jgi:hypothetical protein
MPKDPIDAAREARERAEREHARAARRNHPGQEDSDPPVQPPRPAPTASPYPPITEDYRPGAGARHLDLPPQRNIEATKNAFLGVWGILAVIFGAAAAGWTVHVFFAQPLIAASVKEELKPVRDELEKMKIAQEANQRSNETSFASLGKDIEWLKRGQVEINTQPLKPEKKPR